MKPEPIFNSSRKMPRSASRKMPARVVDSSRKTPTPVSTSSALLVETGSVAIKIAKGYDTSNLYAVTTVQQDAANNAKNHIPTTESLVAALQSTMTTTTNRQPVIIPGTRKRVGSVAQTGKLSRSRHLSPLLRHGLPLGAITVFILFSLFSLSSLADGYRQVPIVGSAIQWVQNEQTNWSLLIGDHAPITQTDPTPQASGPGLDYVAIARQAAISAGIPPNYFVQQIRQESNFNPNAVSPAGAVGIAQFEPSTAAGLGINPYDPVASLYGAARYMARLDNSYGGDYAKALAAYNAGPPAVTRAVNSGGANWLAYMPAETQHYVHAIMG